ncbi:MAG: tRNA (N6-threonylcarbamoyladenosine(37)-N6)-methyltransferase TrmO [Clostridia bacterium]|nr:tRNA (N6-threonylcarbamoyladenosine(37)-N6)-methyltransferase TrmO [Clostridia bacterium]
MKSNNNRDTSFVVIAHIHTDFPAKFGIPRQSGLVDELRGTIVFAPEYRNPDALRGIEGFSHLWLLWQFSESIRQKWQPMVRPPRLGGNTPMGVFATRSPFRPNPIGLSSVRLLGVEATETQGCVLHVAGADLMDGTPIYDIKPYLPYTDSHPDAAGGFAEPLQSHALTVTFPAPLLSRLPEDRRAAAIAVLENDPRPSYQNDPTREYGVYFAGHNIVFFVNGNHLRVEDVTPI